MWITTAMSFGSSSTCLPTLALLCHEQQSSQRASIDLFEQVPLLALQVHLCDMGAGNRLRVVHLSAS